MPLKFTIPLKLFRDFQQDLFVEKNGVRNRGLRDLLVSRFFFLF